MHKKTKIKVKADTDKCKFCYGTGRTADGIVSCAVCGGTGLSGPRINMKARTEPM